MRAAALVALFATLAYALEEELGLMQNDTLEIAFEVNERGAIFDPVTGKRRYDDYQLIRVNPETDEHLSVLRFLDRGKD